MVAGAYARTQDVEFCSTGQNCFTTTFSSYDTNAGWNREFYLPF
jgi:hypothetical protein